MLRLAVFVSGGGTNLQALIDQIEQGKLSDVSIEVVISSKSDAYALERAKKHGIPAVAVTKKDYPDPALFTQELLKYLEKFRVDLIVLAGYLLIVPQAIVRKYHNRIINIHPSLIPSFCGKGYYGLKVHEAALSYGVKVTGATVHFVDLGTDTGPIILQKAVPVLEGDTPEILQRRVMEEAEWQIYPKAIALYAQGRIQIQGRTVKIIEHL